MKKVITNKQAGFTLVELMVVLAIAGVLLAISIPNMRDFFLRQSLKTKANDMLVDFAFARAEAVNRGEPVKISANTNWKDGWKITDVKNVIIRQSNAIDSNVVYSDSAAETVAVVFKPTGSLNAATARVISLENSAISFSKTLTIKLSGSITVQDL